MPAKARNFTRWAIWALPVWALMLFLSTLTQQPDPQTEFPLFAAYVTTNTFLFSHLVNSILGAAIGSVGAVAIALTLLDTRRAGAAITGMVALIVSNTLNTSVFGAAAYAQRGLGQAHLAGAPNALEIYNLVYAAPLFITAAVGMLFFIIAGVFLGIAVSASGRFPRSTGWGVALGMAGFALGVILVPILGNVAAVLLLLATVLIAWTVSRRSAQPSEGAVAFPAS